MPNAEVAGSETTGWLCTSQPFRPKAMSRLCRYSMPRASAVCTKERNEKITDHDACQRKRNPDHAHIPKPRGPPAINTLPLLSRGTVCPAFHPVHPGGSLPLSGQTKRSACRPSKVFYGSSRKIFSSGRGFAALFVFPWMLLSYRSSNSLLYAAMKAIDRRLQTLEHRYIPRRREAGPTKAEILRLDIGDVWRQAASPMCHCRQRTMSLVSRLRKYFGAGFAEAEEANRMSWKPPLDGLVE